MTDPKPGSSPKTPVWTAEVPYQQTNLEHLAEALNMAARIIGVAYTVMCAWQVAKALNPPLQVKQDMAIAALKQRFAKVADELPELANADRAAIYDDLRG